MVLIPLVLSAAVLLPGEPPDGADLGRRLSAMLDTALAKSARRMDDGSRAYAPDADSVYRAAWLRDFAYMAESGRVPVEDVVRGAKMFLGAVSERGEGVDCIKFDGTRVYRPGYGSMGEKAVADGSPFTVSLASLAWRQSGERAFIEAPLLDIAVRAFDAIPSDPSGSGLVWIDPDRDWERCPYGFTDGVRKTGCCLFTSLLTYEAGRRFEEMLESAGRTDAAVRVRRRTERIAASVNARLWDETAGLYRAASVRCREHDVWGSAFAVWLGVAPAARADRIAGVFKENYAGLVSRGQIRHLLPGVYWECAPDVARDTYQNGAFWGTATGWFAGTLARIDRPLALRTIADLVADYERNGACEWHFGGTRACNGGYPANLALPLAAVERVFRAEDGRCGSAGWSLNYGGRRTEGLSSADADAGVRVEADAKAYDDFDAWERTLRLSNRSGAASEVFSEIRELDAEFPLAAGVSAELGVQDGMVPAETYARDDTTSAREFGYRRLRMPKDAELAFETTDGRSSQGIMPFFDLTDGTNGWIIAIGWSGDWRAEFRRTATGVRVRTGLRRCHFRLLPGEEVRTASVLVMRYRAGEDAPNKFRRLVRRHIAERVTATGRVGVTATELWGGLPSATMKERIAAYRDRGLGFDELWLDAGWSGGGRPSPDVFSEDWWTHNGDWFPNPVTHPGGLEDVRDVARAAGMRLMLWFEPERAGEEADAIRLHPEWMLWSGTNRTGSALVNLGHPAAWSNVCETVDALVSKLDLSCYRQDFNLAPAGALAFGEEPDRVGIREIRHVTGLYRLWDTLLERHPGLLIDNCAGGGRRIDLELVRRSVLFCRSDYQCHTNISADVVQAHNAGSSRYLPYNGCWLKLKDLYSLRSSYAASWGTGMWGARPMTMSNADFAALKKALADYRRIKPFLAGDFHNLGSATADPSAWAIWHFRDPAADAGVLLLFRRARSSQATATCALPQLGEGQYVFESLDGGASRTLSGADLRRRGFDVTLETPRSSAIYLYRPVQKGQK